MLEEHNPCIDYKKESSPHPARGCNFIPLEAGPQTPFKIVRFPEDIYPT